jgi:hypothetical protein
MLLPFRIEGRFRIRAFDSAAEIPGKAGECSGFLIVCLRSLITTRPRQIFRQMR